jgi:SEC-C motif
LDPSAKFGASPSAPTLTCLPGVTILSIPTADNTCDCRKTIIQIGHNEKIVSIVSFGWEKPEFYLRWLGSAQEVELAKEMSGVSIDFSSPDLVSPRGILPLVNHLMDETWIARIKENYRLIRKITKPQNIIRMPAKINRNAPCPCGSGKKYKSCCL